MSSIAAGYSGFDRGGARHIEDLNPAAVRSLCLLCAVLLASPVQAQALEAAASEMPPTGEAVAALTPRETEPVDPVLAKRALARAAYGRGEKAFEEGDFSLALQEFESAYRTMPVPVVLRSIAKVEERLGQVVAALEHLHAYLDSVPADAPEHAGILADVARLQSRPAVVLVRTEPAGAYVKVVGTKLMGRAPQEFEVPAGQRRFLLAMPGYDDVRVPLQLASGSRREIYVTFKRARPLVGVAKESGPEDNAAMWIAGGVGVAGALTGGVLGFMALAEKSDFEADPSHGSPDHGNRLALFSDVALGVGVMGLATAVVMYITHEPKIDDDSAEAGVGSLDMALTPLPGGAFAQASLLF